MTESKESGRFFDDVEPDTRSAKEIFNLVVGSEVDIYTSRGHVILDKITAIGEDGNVITVGKTVCTYHPKNKSWYRYVEGQEYRVFLAFDRHYNCLVM